jgi:hypothetical protein
VKSEKLILIWVTVPLLAGCFTRQAVYRVDYVPAPPPKATSTSTDSAQFMVIEEPPPPEAAPSEVTPPEPTPAPALAPAPAHPRHKSTTTAPAQEPSSEPAEPEEPQVPKLEPGETSTSQAAYLRHQIDEIHNRIGALDRARLSAASQKDLDDAANFVGQSKQALDAGDLLRSSNLVHKALLLVEAVQKSR